MNVPIEIKITSVLSSFYVCREIYQKLGDYGQVLQCYLLDRHRKQEVFDYLERFPDKEILEPIALENFNVSYE